MIAAVSRFWEFLANFFPPNLSPHYLQALFVPLSQTIEMAAGAMLVALFIGLLAGIWIAARLPGYRFLYTALGSLRSIPDLTLAIFCVVIVGIGPAAGMLALAIFYSAAIGKIFADLFRSADPEPLEALRATGAGGICQALFNAQQLFFYPQMMAYIVIIWLLVVIVDAASSVVRKRLKLSEVYA